MPDIIEQLLFPEEMPIVEHAPFFLNSGYKLNRQGYRCEDFDATGDIKIVSIGCSNTFGWAIAEEDRFSDIFANLLRESTGKKTVNWNIGYPAKSNDYIARQTINAITLLKPDILLTCFTDIGRREYFGIDYPKMGCFNYIPAEYPKGIKRYAPHFMPYAHRLYNLTSPTDDLVNAYRNIKTVQLAALVSKTPWLFATFCEEETHIILRKFQRYHVGGFPNLDKAADEKHPGPQSNKKLARIFFERYKNDYLDKIPLA